MADGDGVPMQLLIRCGLGIDGGQEPGEWPVHLRCHSLWCRFLTFILTGLCLPGDFWHQLVPQDRDRAREPARDRMRQWSASLIPGALGTVTMALCSRGAMIHVDRIPRRPKAGRPNLQIRSLLPRLETGVGGVDGGDNGLQDEQRVREARQAVNRGAVLPESQAQFLEEIVELSSSMDLPRCRRGSYATEAEGKVCGTCNDTTTVDGRAACSF
ncbi:hypothetical protein Q5P01_000899 [Channa striata]|uniref:Uncharacterized protein n=1 Tax=Channa striata TaxID=64152 RepID=A0AA88IKF5_CHASR|nr:hypothetical protein Q5P01_000899 [Channa striata]